MSIVRLKRLTLIGLAREKTEVLEQIQTLGRLHLVPLTPGGKAPELIPPAHAVDALKALRYLMDEPQRRRQVRDHGDFDMGATVAAVLANQQQLRETTDRRDALAQRIQELTPWGDFELPSDDVLLGRRLWFYIVPLRDLGALRALDLPWQVVHRDNRDAYVVVIHTAEPAPDALPVPRTHTGRLSLSTLHRELEATELEIEDLEAERRSLTRWIHLIRTHLNRAEDEASLRHAASQTFDEESVFAVQGWIPAPDVAAVRALAEARGLAMTVADPARDDLPPTLLTNPERFAAGEDLVGFYQVPAYHSWDPSRLLFVSFAVFFAMILSDAAYAALLGLLLAAFWGRLGRSAQGRRLRIMGATLAVSSLVWGVLVGSYFGVAPPPDSLLGRLDVLDIDDFDTMMRLSVGLGVLHLVIANAQQAYLAWGTMRGFVPIGWIGALLGGYAMWLGSAAGPAALATAGAILLALGLVTVFLASSERPVSGIKSVALRLFDGLSALTGITKVFGDALSYLRLFALGLASGSLALTFNDLSDQVAVGVPGLGLLFQILLLIVGHTLNLALAVMSGVVHGLRLNYIEFYNWALSGEGYPFRPFRKKELSE